MEFDQLMSKYTMPPELSERLAMSFKDLSKLNSVLYVNPINDHYNNINRLPQECTQRLYRAIGEYCASEVAKLFDTDAGKELHRQLMDVMSGAKNGMLIRGLPRDTESKALIIHGIKTLLGDDELNHPERPGTHTRRRNPAYSLPDVVNRGPKTKTTFHRDDTPGRSNPDGKSFLFMASAQQEPYTTPTLFRKLEQPQEGYAEHVIKPDEMIVCNNLILQHSSGLHSKPTDNMARYLIRLTTDDTTLSHTMQHHEEIRDTIKVPHKGEALKNWVLAENDRLEKQAAAFSR